MTTERDARFLCDKVLNLRIFPDEAGKMNLSVRDIGGGRHGRLPVHLVRRCPRRAGGPPTSEAADPEKARALYERPSASFLQSGIPVASGEFQASMEVSYTNVGPVTILLDSEKRF